MPRFWPKRGTDPAAQDGSAARSLHTPGEPVRLYLAREVVQGTMDAGGERLTDVLATTAALRIRFDDDDWRAYRVDDIVLLAPPPHDSQRRIHRIRRRVEFIAPPYTVTGTAYLPPGTQLEPFVLRSGRRVVPVTSVLVRSDNEEVDEDLAVGILMVAAIRSARELMGPA